MRHIETVEQAAGRLLSHLRRRAPGTALLVAMSGIDASGKGSLSALLKDHLRVHGVRATLLNVDGWLNLPCVRLSERRPSEHFYRHAIRFDDLFRQLVSPPRRPRSLTLQADQVEETSTAYSRRMLSFSEVDLALFEGIFLFHRDLRLQHDPAVRVECS